MRTDRGHIDETRAFRHDESQRASDELGELPLPTQVASRRSGLRDEAHRWKGVFYYISPDAQARQLEADGFEFLEALAEDGRTLRPGESTEANGTIHYVCRKR
jgi:hypothetical protein